jgi:heat shock protein HslJ
VRRALLAILILGAALLAASCDAVGPSGGPSASDLPDPVGTAWRLTAIDGAAPPVGPDVTLVIEAGRVSGEGPCNGFGGTLTGDLRSGVVAIADLVSTKRACVDAARGALETAYFAGLRSVTVASFAGPTRLLLSGAGRELASSGSDDVRR